MPSTRPQKLRGLGAFSKWTNWAPAGDERALLAPEKAYGLQLASTKPRPWALMIPGLPSYRGVDGPVTGGRLFRSSGGGDGVEGAPRAEQKTETSSSNTVGLMACR